MKAPIVFAAAVLLVVFTLGCSGSNDSKASGSSSGKNASSTSTGGSSAAGQAPEGGWPSPLLRDPAKTASTGAGSPAEGHPSAASPEAGDGDSASAEMSLGPKLNLTAPEGWVRRVPRSQMIEHEFAVKAAEGDKEEGRVTVMAAGGSVDENVKRWYGQFTQPDGSDTAKKAKKDEKEIAGAKVVVVDIPGTFHDMRGGGPFAPGKTVELPGYRMIAAIIQTSQANYFIKFTGPEKTVAGQAEAFRKMIDGLGPR